MVDAAVFFFEFNRQIAFFQHTHGGDDRNQLRQNRRKRCSRNVQFQHTDEEQISGNIGCAGDADE